MRILAPILALSLASMSAQGWAAPDAQFLSDAMKGDNAEVAIGHMAMEKGANSKVKDFGKMLVDDHSAHKAKLLKMGVPSTNDVTPDAAKARDKLSGLNGQAFDAAFKSHMVEDHEKDIAKYQAQAKVEQKADIKTMIEQTLPTLRKHLATAKSL